MISHDFRVSPLRRRVPLRTRKDGLDRQGWLNFGENMSEAVRVSSLGGVSCPEMGGG